MSLTITASEETLAALIPTLLERIRILETDNASLKNTQKICHAEIKQLKAQLGQTTDVFQLFATEHLVPELGCEVRINDALVAFKTWARFNPGHPAIVTRKQFVARMVELPGAKLTEDGRVISGYRLIDD